MAVRMMIYVGLLYQDLIRSKDSLPGRQLHPVRPYDKQTPVPRNPQ